MIEQYIKICNLLDCIGEFNPRLVAIQQMIQDVNFRYDPLACPEILTNTFLASSYWLDQELFDESYLYKKENENLSSMQKAHLKMVDIGANLLDKGFPLDYEAEKFNTQGTHQLASYAKTFAQQCHKRHDFLHKRRAQKLIFPSREHE